MKVWTACNTTQTETSVLGGCPDDFVPLKSSRETGSYQLFIDTHSQREQIQTERKGTRLGQVAFNSSVQWTA